MFSLRHLPFSLLLFLNPTLSQQQSDLHDNSPNCTCYMINSTTRAYFQYHRFWDFRNLGQQSLDQTYGEGSIDEPPPTVNNTQDAGDEPVWDPAIFDSDSWNADWSIQNWSKPATSEFPVKVVNSPANIYLLSDSDSDNSESYLTLRTTRLDDFQSAAEIENLQKNLLHASLRVRARVRGASGAVAGFFTFADDDNESDIEILTRDEVDMVRYTNQPALTPDGDTVSESSVAPADLPSWTEFRTHRIDWLPKQSAWFLDEEQTATNTYSVPRIPSGLILNMWSDGGEWSGNMTVGDSAEVQITWVEMVFNTSGPVEGVQYGSEKRSEKLEERKGKGCKVVCKIDDVREIGTPEVVSMKESMAAARMGADWIVLGIAILAIALGT